MKKNSLSQTQIIVLVFFALIILGSILLSLPISSKTNSWTFFLDALFTATSATCVTGLIVYDTYAHWSIFGQIVILLLIQIGGIGFMSLITLFSIFMKRKIGIRERQLLVQSTGILQSNNVIRLVKQIIKISLIIELIGALLLALRFCPQMGLLEGLYNAIFHSVTAFCNAGFDLMGKYGQFSSLTYYSTDIIVNLTITILIIVGGLGFIVWDDILLYRFNFKKYQLHSKISIITTSFLFIIGWILFFVFEKDNLLANLNFTDKILVSLFQSVTPRTAGFSTININNFTESSFFLTVIFMFIGGNSGSTAGGVKVTTLSIMLLSVVASIKDAKNITIFKRKIDNSIVRLASSFITIYLLFTCLATLVLCSITSFSFKEIIFEVVSAIGTVGLTLGITTLFDAIPKMIIILLMFIGRVGWLTLILAFSKKYVDPPIERISEKILIG